VPELEEEAEVCVEQHTDNEQAVGIGPARKDALGPRLLWTSA